MPRERFEGIDGHVKAVLMNIEEHASHSFMNPMLLLEALQSPGSSVRWNDSKDHRALGVVGEYVIGLAAVEGEYRLGGLPDRRGIYHPS